MPRYCDLVALNSSVSSCVTAPVAQITWICGTPLLQEFQIKIRQQDVDTVHTDMFPVHLKAIRHIISKCRSRGTTSVLILSTC